MLWSSALSPELDAATPRLPAQVEGSSVVAAKRWSRSLMRIGVLVGGVLVVS